MGGGGRFGGGIECMDACSDVMEREDLFDRIEFLFGGTGGGVLDRMDALLDLIDPGDVGRMDILSTSFVDLADLADFIETPAIEFVRMDFLSKLGVGGREVLGAGNRGGGKSAAVGEAAEVGGKPAALSSSALWTTGSASSYMAEP